MPKDPLSTANSKREIPKLIGGKVCYKKTIDYTCRGFRTYECSVKICGKENGCGKYMCDAHAVMATGSKKRPNEKKQYMCEDCSLKIQAK